MITLRPAKERGHFDHGWLDTYHTFSFGDYYDEAHMGYSVLRVLNEDRVAPGRGFPPHPHRDMEILTWVLEGGLQHGDNMGNGSVIRPGDVQRMSAGTGVVHSEKNASATEPVHFLQIWILPGARNLPAGYEQKPIPESGSPLRLIGSPDGRDDSVTIHQDVRLYVAQLGEGEEVKPALAAGRKAWVQIARGAARIGPQALQQGDGASVEDEPSFSIRATQPAEILVFDLP